MMKSALLLLPPLSYAEASAVDCKGGLVGPGAFYLDSWALELVNICLMPFGLKVEGPFLHLFSSPALPGRWVVLVHLLFALGFRLCLRACLSSARALPFPTWGGFPRFRQAWLLSRVIVCSPLGACLRLRR